MENPVAGERITWIRTGAQTGGAVAEMELELGPASFLAADHVHLRQEEFFEEFFRLAREGRSNARGMPPVPVAARLGLTHDMYFAHTPVPIQRATMRMLTGIARVLPADRR